MSNWIKTLRPNFKTEGASKIWKIIDTFLHIQILTWSHFCHPLAILNDIYSITSRTKRYILLVACVFVILILEGYFTIIQDEIIQGPYIKKWICQGCDKSFNSKRAVKQHQRRRNCGRNEVVWKNIAMFNYLLVAAYYLLIT